ncbi:ANM_HP_G0247990.mRNA.1.CDS.1 [Saccharomyces cerevisiae]|nr:ANM_HP_G0247990.mRNA.1.CDS.1 [Saccharomyces cerevisiae]CAI7005588.1 ANM_HP_G0247990.mRNA.1.CDS.1 [Saccharomyces cerevisiae]
MTKILSWIPFWVNTVNETDEIEFRNPGLHKELILSLSPLFCPNGENQLDLVLAICEEICESYDEYLYYWIITINTIQNCQTMKHYLSSRRINELNI